MSLIIYRGDNYLNTDTNPGIYRGNGLTAKAFFSGGDPAYINKKGLLESIRMHVNPLDANDKAIYNITSFLSFTEDFDKALMFAAHDQKGIIEVPDNYTETRYIFTASFSDSDLPQISDGIYEYKFACNRHLKKANSPDTFGVATYALQYDECPVCRSIEKSHSLLLINTCQLLEKHKHLNKYEGAYDNARNDKEWLLLPSDPLGKFRSARIPRADFWTGRHYRLLSEPPRDSKHFANQGYI